MKEQKARSVVFSQLAECQLQFFRQVKPTQPCCGCCRFDHRLHRSCPRLELRLMSAATIDGDGQDPRLQWSFAIPMMEVANRPNERLLSDIFRILVMPQLAHADREDQSLELLDKFQQPVAVAGQAALDESPVIHLTASLSGDEYPRREPQVSESPHWGRATRRSEQSLHFSCAHRTRLRRFRRENSQNRNRPTQAQRVICSRANWRANL